MRGPDGPRKASNIRESAPAANAAAFAAGEAQRSGGTNCLVPERAHLSGRESPSAAKELERTRRSERRSCAITPFEPSSRLRGRGTEWHGYCSSNRGETEHARHDTRRTATGAI